MDCYNQKKWSYFCASQESRGRIQKNDKSWQYNKCSYCGTIRIDQYENMGEVYKSEKVIDTYKAPPYFVKLKHSFFGHPTVRLLRKKNFKNDYILDVGCSNGEKLFEFYKRNAKGVFGVELTERKLQVARRYMPNGKFYAGSLRDSPFPKNHFDYVVVDNVLEHIHRPDEFVQELYNYTKPGGRLVIFVPNACSFTVRFLKKYAMNVWPPFHVNLFTKKYFIKHFPNLDLSFKTRSYFNTIKISLVKSGCPRVIAVILSLVLLPFAREELVVFIRRSEL